MNKYLEIKNNCPLLVTKYYELADNYIKISQPMTAIEIYLTGDTKIVWSKIEENEGRNIESVYDCITKIIPDFTIDEFVDIIDKLISLNLISLTAKNDLYNILDF